MTLVLENPELEARLLQEAKKRGLRPEEVALEMLREKLSPRVFHDADFLIGTLSDEDHAVFLENIAAFERVDEQP
jgi:undecaprenyl pyrophosphate synthase